MIHEAKATAKASNPANLLTPDEIAYLETKGYDFAAEHSVIRTIIHNDRDRAEADKIDLILEKLPKGRIHHIIVEIIKPN